MKLSVLVIFIPVCMVTCVAVKLGPIGRNLHRIKQPHCEGVNSVEKVADILNMMSKVLKTSVSTNRDEPPFGYLFTSDEFHGTSGYKFLPSPRLTYLSAKKECNNIRSDLVSIETEQEMLHLQHIIQSNNSLEVPSNIRFDGKIILDWGGYWTSGTDEENEGHWIWEATGQKVIFNQWLLGQPSNTLSEQHNLAFSTDNYGWFDTTGHKFKKGTLCERGIYPV